jgi:hypothetical protein
MYGNPMPRNKKRKGKGPPRRGAKAQVPAIGVGKRIEHLGQLEARKNVEGRLVAMVDVSKLERPPLVGFASECFIEERDDHWLFVFFDSRWGIVTSCAIGTDDLALAIFKRSESFFTQVVTWIRERNVPMRSLATSLPETVALTRPPAMGNLAVMSRSGLDAQLDLFYLTAHSVARASQGQSTVEVLPLFSLQLPTTLLAAILTRIQSRLDYLDAPSQRSASEETPA